MRVGEESVGSLGATIRRHGTQTVLVLLTGKVLSDYTRGSRDSTAVAPSEVEFYGGSAIEKPLPVAAPTPQTKGNVAQ